MSHNGTISDLNFNDIESALIGQGVSIAEACKFEIGDIGAVLIGRRPVCAVTGESDCRVCSEGFCERHLTEACMCDMIEKHAATIERIGNEALADTGARKP